MRRDETRSKISAVCSAVCRVTDGRLPTLLEGNPWYRNTSRKNSSAVSLLLAVLYVGINIAIFVRRSIMIKIISWLDVDSGNGPKKSIAIDSQARLGIGKGCSFPIGG